MFENNGDFAEMEQLTSGNVVINGEKPLRF